ncbi:hypothetical protein AB0D56_26985 [Streptomyces sp. NPDC048209]|uniref:hypothetical protein n=1 Tax=Streptomyces sp. NPDC048209 TaxID=3156689 RepID=UPI0034364A01
MLDRAVVGGKSEPVKTTHYRVLLVLLVGLLAAAVAVILAVLDRDSATDAIRNADLAFVGTTTLGLLLNAALKGESGQGAQ